MEDVRDSIATIHLGGEDGSVAEGGKQLARMPTHVRVGLLSCVVTLPLCARGDFAPAPPFVLPIPKGSRSPLR